MRTCSLALACAMAFAAFNSQAAAQFDEEEEAAFVSDSSQDDASEDQAGEEDEGADSDDEPPLPPVVVEAERLPRDSEAPTRRSRSASPPTYPGLSQQGFSGFDGYSGLARGERSIFDTPQLSTVIGRSRLSETVPLTTADALAQEVGILMQKTNHGGGSPVIRGLQGNEILVLVDGIRLNNSIFRFGANQYFNLIDPGAIERIEVVRGPQSVLFGSDALGGAINIVTRRDNLAGPEYTGGQWLQRFSSADMGSYTRLNVEGSVGGGGLFAGASYLNVHNLDIGGGFGRQRPTDYSQGAGDVKFNYLLDDDTLLTASLQHLEQKDVPRTDFFRFRNRSLYFDPQQRDLAYLRLQGLNLGGPVDAYTITGSYQRNKEGQRERASLAPLSVVETQREFSVDTYGVNALFATEMDWLGRLTYGVDWYRDSVATSAFNLNTATGATTATAPQFPDGSKYQRVGAYAQWDVQLTPRLAAIGGARYENIDANSSPLVRVAPGLPTTPLPISPSFQDWSGSVGLVYELEPGLHLVGSIAEGFRAPNLDDLTTLSTNVGQGIDLANPSLSPEHSLGYEVGFKTDYGRFRSQTAVFWTDLQDYIVRQQVGTLPGPPATRLFERVNHDAFLNGVEFQGEYLLWDGWSMYGNVSQVRGTDLTLRQPLQKLSPIQGLAGLRWRDRLNRSFVEVYTYTAARQSRLSPLDLVDPRVPAGGTPGFATLNMRAGARLGCNQRLSLGIENLTDKLYLVHGSGINGPGISFNLGYELSR